MGHGQRAGSSAGRDRTGDASVTIAAEAGRAFMTSQGERGEQLLLEHLFDGLAICSRRRGSRAWTHVDTAR